VEGPLSGIIIIKSGAGGSNQDLTSFWACTKQNLLNFHWLVDLGRF
jgi:hypothetical protein